MTPDAYSSGHLQALTPPKEVAANGEARGARGAAHLQVYGPFLGF